MINRPTVKNKKSGFTLIEMIISVGVFSVVMLISVGSLVLANDAFRKTRLLRNAVENASITLEGMSKKIRVGTTYNCDASQITTAEDCVYDGTSSGGDSYLSFYSEDNSIIEYQYDATNKLIKTRTCVYTTGNESACDDNLDPFRVITSPDVEITDLKFYVEGAEKVLQPKVTILISGEVNLPGKSDLDTSFSIQTTVSQRIVSL